MSTLIYHNEWSFFLALFRLSLFSLAPSLFNFAPKLHFVFIFVSSVLIFHWYALGFSFFFVHLYHTTIVYYSCVSVVPLIENLILAVSRSFLPNHNYLLFHQRMLYFLANISKNTRTWDTGFVYETRKVHTKFNYSGSCKRKAI